MGKKDQMQNKAEQMKQQGKKKMGQDIGHEGPSRRALPAAGCPHLAAGCAFPQSGERSPQRGDRTIPGGRAHAA